MEDKDGERVHATSWTGAPDGSAYDTNVEEAIAESAENLNELAMDTSRDSREGYGDVNADAVIRQLGIRTEQLNSIVIRRTLALKWIEQQEKCYQFLPISLEDTPDWTKIKSQIINGPHGVRLIKCSKGKKPSSGKLNILKSGFKNLHLQQT